MFSMKNYRHVFEEKVTPVILDVEQEGDDDTNVDQANQHHYLSNIKYIISALSRLRLEEV